LLKSIMNGLVRFFKEKHKSFKLFLSEMKESIRQFISHISSFVRTGASSALGTVISDIFGPIVSLFKKLASLIKQGVSSLVEAVHYLTNKQNRDKPISVKIAQVGKIVTAGLVASGAIFGGELLEKALLQIPVMNVKIPYLGTIANIAGMFLASLICGVIGAIVINRIDKYIAKQQTNENLDKQIDKKNEVLAIQDKLLDEKSTKLERTKANASQNISDRHRVARDIISDSLAVIFREEDDDDDIDEKLNNIDTKLDGLFD